VPLVEPPIFELYTHWLYSDKVQTEALPNDTEGGSLSTGDASSSSTTFAADPERVITIEKMQQCQQLRQLYVAGNLLLDAEPKNRVMDELCSKNEQGTYRTWSHSIPYV